MTVGIVTDSAAALPAALAKEFDIGVVPILLAVDGRNVATDALNPTELIAAGSVSTAAPSPGAFAREIAEHQGPDGVLVLTVSATLSGCHQSARLGAAEVGGRTVVVDTASAAGGQALAVHAAAEAAAGGADLDTVAAVARRVAGRVHLMGVLSGLEQLVRSGRIPAVAGWTGDRLKLRPVFDLHAGRVRRLLPARSVAGAHRKMLEQLRRSRPADATAAHIAAVHAAAPDDGEKLLELACQEVQPATAFLAGFGAALVATAGTGVTGLAWWWDTPNDR